ncbi:MAG TPA: amidohydrolase family protein, partial [Chitinophagales bacterium]|nr:amidohydrolase family protein [Chitinophagales bacterium]
MQIKSNYIDISNKEIYPAKITIENGKIKLIEKINELLDTYIFPGFVDAHVHIESSMLVPTEFAKKAVIHGTVATVSDPHEIANVLGKEGVYYMIENGKKCPFKFNFGAPSCVPATKFETAGAEVTVEDIDELMALEEIKYLAEMMNYPGVLFQ